MSAKKREKVLTEEIMLYRLCSISDFSDMTPGAAKLFTNHLNSCFKNDIDIPEELSDLGWLRTISEQTAKEVSKCSAIEKSNFNEFTTLSDEAAKHLAKIKYFGRYGNFKYDEYDNPRLSLNNIKSLSDKAIHYLSNYQGKELSLGIESLSDKAAATLGKFKGKGIKHKGWEPYAAASINRMEDREMNSRENWRSHPEFHIGLSLNGLKTMSDRAAEALAKYNGDGMSLMGLSSMSDGAAKALSTYKGWLFLDGLQSLSDTAAASFGKKNKLSLMGLKLNEYISRKRERPKRMPANKAVNLTSKNFHAKVMQSATPVLVYFYAEWCGACKNLSPIVDQIAEENESEVRVGKVDISRQGKLAQKSNIEATPTLLLFKGGQLEEQKVGSISKVDLQAMLDNYRSQAVPGSTGRCISDLALLSLKEGAKKKTIRISRSIFEAIKTAKKR